MDFYFVKQPVHRVSNCEKITGQSENLVVLGNTTGYNFDDCHDILDRLHI